MEDQQKKITHFLEPETRCDHYISGDTKALWKAMLDMAEEVDRICRKHNIKYFLIAGSLLGAIRHKGFIPWDDDFDIALFRDEYEKLEKILPKELPPNMFMQTIGTDLGYCTGHMKIRLSGTTAIQDNAIYGRLCHNMGIFIDIFALEGVPKTRILQKIKIELLRFWINFILYHNMGVKFSKFSQRIKKNFCNIIWSILGSKNIYKIHEWLSSYPINKNGECVQCPTSWGYDQRYRYKVSDFQSTIDVPFEYLSLQVPKNYNKILTEVYGDWRKFVKGGSAHNVVHFSSTIDFKQILREKYAYTDEEIKKCTLSL